MKFECQILAGGMLRPVCDEDLARLSKMKTNDVVMVDVKRVRNYRFHRKFFALLTFAFDLWCERGTGKGIEYKGQHVLPNFEQFREDIVILCGFYEMHVRLDGTVRVKAKSIAFANMEQDDFDQLYDKAIDVILHKVIPQVKMTEHELREAVNVTIGFV